MNYILKDENAVFYECGFSCDNVIFIKLSGEAFFITDGRYYEEAKESVKNAEVIESSDLFKSVREILRKNRITKLFYDPFEWSIEEFYKLNSKLSKCHFQKKIKLSQKKRIIKSKEEIETIKKAVKLGAAGFKNFADFLIRSGVGKDEKRLQFEAGNILRKKGELDISFSPIVAVNENSAKPHALPSEKKLKSGDLLLFDAGVKYKRYCSDRTRMMEFGSSFDFDIKKSFKDKKRQKIYDTVLKAKDAAWLIAKEGVKAKDVDKAAREVIAKAGYEKYFIHSTGHGVGLDIHELPVISKRDDTVLKEGMVFTIEPGIYLPGEFGIRIEDMYVIQNGKATAIYSS